MLKKKNIFLALICLFSSFSLSAISITGSDSYVKEFKNISSFRKLYLSAGPMEVYLTQGNGPSVRLEGDKAAVEQLDVKVMQGELDILYKQGQKKPKSSGTVKVYITARTLTQITARGSVELSSEKSWKVESLNLLLTGSSSITLPLNATSFSAQISGSSEVKTSGSAQSQNIAITGSGVYSAEDLKSNSATIILSGAGSASVFVKKTMNVTIYGSGDVEYKGTPQIESNIYGSGKIKKASLL